MRVLVVDEDAFLGELVKLALEAEGHTCFAVAGAEQATEILRTVAVDLVTLDLMFDPSSALRWLEGTVLAHPELHDRIFVLSDRALTPDEASHLLTCGARVIQKPFTLDQVRETVGAIVPAGASGTGREARGPILEA